MSVTEEKPKIYEYTVCPFCHKVKALLLYKNIPFDSIEVDPMKKREISFSKEYKKVPIVIDKNGVQVNNSTEIMRHLDKQYPGAPVFETEEEKMKLEEKWLTWSDQVFVRALPPLVYDKLKHSVKAFHYITKEGKFSWWQKRCIKYFGAFVMWIVAKKSAKRQQITCPKKHFANVLDEWNEALKGKDFLGGEKPNGADLAIFGIIHSTEELPAFEFVKQKATILNWYQRVKQKVNNR